MLHGYLVVKQWYGNSTEEVFSQMVEACMLWAVFLAVHIVRRQLMIFRYGGALRWGTTVGRQLVGCVFVFVDAFFVISSTAVKARAREEFFAK